MGTTGDKKVVVVGGGITGLAAAYRLQKSDLPLHLTVLEGADRVGGKLETEHYQGFTLEHGPDIFLARKPRGVEIGRAHV